MKPSRLMLRRRALSAFRGQLPAATADLSSRGVHVRPAFARMDMGIPSVVRARRWRLILAGIVVLVAGIATETAAYAFGCVWNQSMPVATGTSP